MLLSGKVVADEIQEEIRHSIQTCTAPRKPGLAFFLIGFHPPSHAYVNRKKQACAAVGISSRVVELPDTVSEEELLASIQEVNRDETIDGLLVQLPLPPSLPTERILAAIDPAKDVDGLHPLNMGKLLLGREDGFIPCTPLGIQTLLLRSGIEMSGKHVVIVGRSQIVGRPLAALLVQKKKGCNATVTVAHSQTTELAHITKSADILVAAIGQPRFIKAEMVKEGAVVIDVGINREEDPQYPQGYHLVGDVDFNSVESKCSAITPVPKGVGPMTVAMLLHNTLLSFQRKFL